MQTAKVLAFPAAAPAPFGPRPDRRDHPQPGRLPSSEIDFAGVAHKLGMANAPTRAIIDTIRRLMPEGFPPPKNPRFWGGRRLKGARAVCKQSVWSRDLVERWFDEDTPPPAASLLRTDRAVLRADLARRAQALVA